MMVPQGKAPSAVDDDPILSGLSKTHALMAAAVVGLQASALIQSRVLFTLIAGSIAGIVYGLGLLAVGGVDRALLAKIPLLRR